MRSSNLSHLKNPAKNNCRHAKPENNTKKFSKLGSIVVTALVVFSAVIIPSVTLIQNVEAVTSVKNAVFSVGDNDVFSDVIVNSGKPEKAKAEKKEAAKKAPKKAEKKAVKEKVEETTAAATAATTAATAATTAAETEAATAQTSVAKNSGVLSTANVDTSYIPSHISLSSYDRDKLERLVMGEAGSLGYNGAALVAQAIRDSMTVSGTTSVDAIISSYQYTASTAKAPTSAVKSAVSYIFDNDGYAVQHRILYFYATNVVSNAWHESQQFIVSYGNMRFFDQW